MLDEKMEKVVAVFTRKFLDSVRELASSGEKLNQRSLFDAVSKNPELAASLSEYLDKNREAKKETSETSDHYHDYINLNQEYERALSQKDKMLKELSLLEEKGLEIEAFYKKTMLVFTDLLRGGGNPSLDLAVRQFRELVKKNAERELLENAFENIRAKALSETPEEQDEKKTATRGKSLGFLGKWLKTGIRSEEPEAAQSFVEIDYYVQFKETYLDIVNELKRVLSEEFLEQLSEIEEGIYKAENLSDYRGLRKKILGILQDYIASVSTDREQAAAFISDISRKLIDVEKFMLSSLAVVDSGFKSNATFSHSISLNLDNLKTDMAACDSLETMHKAVIEKITLISLVLEKKKQKDLASKKRLDKQVLVLEESMQEMEKGLAEASIRAERLEMELSRDPLTGAENRRSYEKRVREEMDRYLRYRHPFSVIIFDVDHFKNINDSFGHAIGDKCLKEMIARVRPLVRNVDMLARFGGEEFVLLLPETGLMAAAGVAEKLREAVESIKFVHKNDAVTITISLGVTEVLPEDPSFDVLFQRVDAALYEAKKSGRNRVVKK